MRGPFSLVETDAVMVTSLVAGITFGLSAGLFPGPLMAFIISQTLRHGFREGFKGSFAPLFTDPPIMLASVLLMSSLSGYGPLLGAVSCLGGLFVLYLGWECLRAPALQINGIQKRPRSLGKAVLLNALSPHPYLFWFLVGGPYVSMAWHQFRPGVSGFVLGFYGCLVGAMALVAVLVGQSRGWLTGRPYRYLMVALGLALGVAGVMLLGRGLTTLGLLGGEVG